jgi:hypothetical protein
MATARGRLKVVGSTTPPEEARRREQAFQDWMAGAETAYLECRIDRHIMPGISDERTSKEVHQGVCVIERACVRCGVVLRKLIGVRNGYLVGGGRSNYDYSRADGYLLPPEATGPGGSAMDREHRGQLRLEVIDRAFRARGSSLYKQMANDAKRNKRR